jgi:hypothetical protein
MAKKEEKKLISKIFSQLDQPTLKKAMRELTKKRKMKISRPY